MSDPAIVDAAQRAQALDVTRSFIVQAPAGSGKTELLTQRYLCLLANVTHPEEICAITFTRKAAAEMRNRVLNALDRAHAPEPSKAHERQTWQLARAALAQDRVTGSWHRTRTGYASRHSTASRMRWRDSYRCSANSARRP